ncbi:hypothetical protein [Paenibacillus daejeonensis]|uniref:hypothetical protein n=1 Tax=Paenibacillus daejeonensis TaxID=135193 RepID=UPI000379687B|nr:hypothetical protein [Paenibacillus daejeonensis]
MRKRWVKPAVIGLTVLTMLASPLSVLPQPVAEASMAQLSKQWVRLGSSGVLNVRDAQFLMQEKGKVLAVTVGITNNSSRSLSLLDYWVRVKSKSGKTFKASLLEADKAKTMVPPNSSLYLTYYAVVDLQTNLSDLLFDVIEWDFDQPNYEKRLGRISVPSGTTGKTPAFQANVMLYQNSKLRGALKSYIATRDNTNTYVTLQYLIENVGFRSADLSGLKFYAQTDGMSVYGVNFAASKETIEPKERKIVTLLATIPNSVATKPLSLIAATSDEASKVELPLGVFQLPAIKTTTPAAAGSNRLIYLNGQLISTKTAGATVEKTEDGQKQTVELAFHLQNTDNRAASYANLDFVIETTGGAQYPLTFTKEEQTMLLPKIEKKLTLTGEIPANLKIEDAIVVVRSAPSEETRKATLGTYKISRTVVVPENNSGTIYQNKDYRLHIDSVNRIATEGNDLLVADLVITNPTSESKAIPVYQGHFLINGVKTPTQSFIPLDQSVTIAPGGTYNVAVYSEIPYTSVVNDLSFVLTEKVEDKPDKTLFRFDKQMIRTLVPQKQDRVYEIKNVGRQASVKLQKSAIHRGAQANEQFYYGEFEVTNHEIRLADPTKLQGYLKDNAGLIVPISFVHDTARITPKAKALYAAVAKIPATFNKDKFALYLGQSIVTEAGGEGSAAKTLMVKPVAYEISPTLTYNETLKNITFAGNLLNFRELQANLKVTEGENANFTGFDFKIKYDYTRDANYETAYKDQKLVFEIVDAGEGKVTYNKEIRISPSDDGNAPLLKEGQEVSLDLVFEDPAIMSKIRRFREYQFNVYTVVDNHKLLIASKELKWQNLEKIQ